VVGRLVSPRFVGRRAELGALRVALARAVDGAGSVAVVEGEAGVGKSRLVAELATEARRDGATVLVGECLALGEGELPYGPIITVLRSLARERGTDALAALAAAGHDQLARLLPELEPAARDGSQARLFGQLLTVLTSVARADPPVLLVIEDLHWSDRATRDFLAFLVRAARHEPIALVLTYRTDDVGGNAAALAFVHELKRGGHAARLTLNRFGHEEVREQVASIRNETPDPALIDRLLDRAEGNAFFTEELVAADDGRDALPESLRQALLLRFAGCSDDVSRVIHTIAVAGREIEHELLETIVPLGDQRLTAALRNAVDGQILVHPRGSTRYAFRHALLSEAAYSDLLPGERRSMHATIAEAIQRQPSLGGTPAAAAAMVAHHWYEAGAPSRALIASIDAALAAERVYASGEALTHYRRALALWDAAAPGSAPALDRIAVLRGAAGAASRLGEGERAVELDREALARIGDGDPVAAALTHARLGRHLWEAGRGEDALPELRRAVELMPERPTSERAQVLATEAQILMLCHRFTAAETRCHEALSLAQALGARDVEAHALNTVAASFTYAGRPELGAGAANEALTIARGLSLVEQIGRAYVNGSDALDYAGQVQTSIALAHEGIETCRELGVDGFVGDCLRGEIAGRLLRCGRWDAAAETLEELFGNTPTGIGAGNGFGHLALLCAMRGEHERMLEAADCGERFVGLSGGSMWLAPLAEARITGELWAGRPDDAARIADTFLSTVAGAESILSTIRIYELGVRAAADGALRAVGDERATDDARARATKLLSRADDLIAPLFATPIRVRASRQAAAAERVRIDGGDPGAPAAWERAALLWSQCDDTYQAAYARFRRAEASLMAGGDRHTAANDAREAHLTAAELRARPLTDAIDALARRARLDLGVSLRSGPDGADGNALRVTLERLALTPRELEVLALVGEGMSNPQIAAELFISNKTASVHVSRILAKLSVPSRAAAAGEG
jgi:DNA-binding CsgD family transcriptional regulator/tetratricopeptide (TPR) repeat protein